MAWWDKLGEGIRVERAVAALADGPLFNIAGGKVLMTALVGEITVDLAASGATLNTKLVATPTTGDATDLCANTNIDTYGEGNVLGITGVPTDNLMPAAEHASIPGMTTDGVILTIGTLDLDTEAVTAATSLVKWTLFYIPIDDGAVVTAA